MAVAGNRGHLWGEQHRIKTRTKRNHSRVNSGRLTIGGNYSRSPKGDMVVVEGDEAAVGNGDAVSVTPEIGENRGRSAERLLGIDDPVDVPHGGEMGSEGRGLGEMRQIAEEA